jgi:hypothetical protein
MRPISFSVCGTSSFCANAARVPTAETAVAPANSALFRKKPRLSVTDTPLARLVGNLSFDM